MKDSFEKFTSSDEWMFKENKWDKTWQSSRESQFALGNGFLGSRGILEEVPWDSRPGTYIAGLYDKAGARITEIVNLPNPINLKIMVDGERMGIGTMDMVSHERQLDMKQGLLLRHTVYKNSHKKRFDYQSVRFVSMRNKHIIAMQVCITPLDEKATVTVQNMLDLSVTNVGFMTEGNKKHFRIEDVSQFDTGEYIGVRTLEKDILVAYGKSMIIEKNGSRRFAKDVTTHIKLKKGQTACITCITSIFKSDEKKSKNAKQAVKTFLKKSIRLGFDRILKEHIESWEKLWAISDIQIKGSGQDQKSLRFNIYHLLICGFNDNGASSIGAKTLTGEGYRGHIFWDADIFIMPFFIYTRPKIAKSMLLYRYNRLPMAKNIAESHEYKGAMFPWESADTGEECTPAWAKDYDGSIIKIRTHELEHHITADVAYGVYHYYVVTQDHSFMMKYGLEIIFETARFWASRVEYNPKLHMHEIKHVIGPDEFHEDVDNNMYTNYMARFNLLIAYGMYQRLKKLNPKGFSRITDKINLTPKEVNSWKKLIYNILFKVNLEGLIEQFEGYYRKRKVILKNLKRNPIPPIPRSLQFKDISKTQLLKQADVLMLLYLLSDNFDLKTKKKNFYYYLKRTLHKSSLSAAVHASLAAELGALKTAYRYFNVASNMDINLTYGNTDDGMHAASLGVTWQAVIFGFCGTRVANETLSIDPRLPKDWKGVSFLLRWQGDVLDISVTNNKVTLKLCSRKKDKKKVKVFGSLRKIGTDKTYIFSKEER
ncbi:MAG: glycosyl hydrolase family 65 protein [Candidatus Omnitrophota bacterium]